MPTPSNPPDPGPPTTLVAVHGNGGGAFRFAPAAPHVPQAVRLLTPTLPGFGGRPLPPGPTTLATFTEDLLGTLEGLPRPLVLLGHGIGGAVALQALAEEPGAADGLVLHAPVGTRLDTRLFPRVMRSGLVQETARRAISAPLLAPLWRATIVRSMPPSTAGAFLRGYADCEAFGVMFDLLDAAWFDALPAMDLPAVLLWGADDRVLGADQRADYHRLLPDAVEHVVPGWGHFPMFTDPAGYARTVAAVAVGLAARVEEAAGRTPGHVLPVGGGQLGALGVPGKAARLEALGGLVPDAVVVPDGADAITAAGQAAGWLGGPAPSGSAGRTAGDRVAVRSAFGSEDGGTSSMAGAHTSLLDVAPTPEALADAITVVRGSGPSTVRRDVLVMRMVRARTAGVAFLQSGHLDDLVEHVDGLADGLLAGEVDGRRSLLPRQGLGTAPAGWPARLQSALAEVRDAMGDGEWDVEWADDGARAWVVQVRPITAPPLREEALTAANHREILPDPPSRLMTSLIVDAGHDVFGYWQGFDAEVPRGRAFTEELALRPWINLDLLTDTMRVLGLPTSLVTDTMGGASHVDEPANPRRLLRKLPALARMGLDQVLAVDRTDAVIDELHGMAVAAQDTRGFADTVDLAREVYVRLLTGMFPLSTAVSVPLAVLAAAGVAGDLQHGQVSAGTAVLRDLDAVRAAAHDEEDLRALVEDRPVSIALQRAWDAYLGRHGHRGIYESDLARPRFAEDPAPLRAMLGAPLRGGLAAPLRGGLGAPSSQAADVGSPPGPTTSPASRTPVRTVLARTLGAPVWWQARRAVAARERYRSEAMKAFQALRRRLLELAEDAVADGRLPEAAALWDLTVEEVRALDDGAGITAGALAARREELARAAALVLPDLVRRTDDLEALSAAADPAAGGASGPPGGPAGGPVGDVLRGRGLTRGVVEGTVVVLHEPGPLPPDLPAGPVVLVTRAVDVGWVTAFAHVDAVVVETGGDLSHGSIILREIGLPAVTNATGAGRVLRTGDRVRVDGRSGVVRRTAPATPAGT